ncbi:MAG: prolipoprotein diacylglyceryl transferase [Oscillospiraceae bacterium]|nr:prolipoprotein diacylglyceryl transferase [Oscillospiraceae bacterium]
MDMTSLNLAENEIAFPGLGIDGITVNSVAFSLFGIDIAWYGIIIAAGMTLAIIFGLSQMKKFGIEPDRATDVIIGGIIGGVIGARAYYVIMNWQDYAGDWKSIFQTRNGGLAIYGGVIGALLVGVVMCRIRKVRILPLFDVASMGFLIGQGIGRWGNFFNHEAFGTNTDLPWGMTSGRIQQWIAENNEYGTVLASLTPERAVHPCFLYESIWCLLGFAVLFIISKHRKFDGQIFLCYILWYGTGRAVIEGLRTDSLMVGSIRISQLLAIVSAVAALILICVFTSKVNRMGGEYVFYKDTEESKRLIAEAEEQHTKEKTKK